MALSWGTFSLNWLSLNSALSALILSGALSAAADCLSREHEAPAPPFSSRADRCTILHVRPPPDPCPALLDSVTTVGAPSCSAPCSSSALTDSAAPSIRGDSLTIRRLEKRPPKLRSNDSVAWCSILLTRCRTLSFRRLSLLRVFRLPDS
uniref:Putative secreted protein n=1 Tax=Anopheles darlingi TaxID=43151 RepID=A0A2M4DFW4_ANODA